MNNQNVFRKDGKALVSRVTASVDIEESVKKAVDLIGGFKKVIDRGDRVLVKPNFNSDDPFPASSDPEFVKAVVSLLYESGASNVAIFESSGRPWLPTKNVMEKTGMLSAAEECGAEVKILDDRDWADTKIGGQYWQMVSIARDALDTDAKFIWLPCMKTHKNARFSLSLKLAVGLLEFSQRSDLHSVHLEEKIAELNLAVNPDLIIMDGRKCFVTGGPASGHLEKPNVLLASGDRIAIDVEALNILKSYKAENRLNMPIWEFPQIKQSVELGLGIRGEDEISVLRA
ncbi:MAG: DUF362 domain-containing protein [Candidatus Bathyarchaeota archaeon]|nr:MAG: DUF362 domain-containing protein [Candidatus Bathyarchaeota archaeon]